MLVTVLGKSPAWEDAAGACSGYLVQQDGFTLLLDCGSGVFSKLRACCDYLDVDAVLITHMHADHFFDLIPFAYALRYTSRRQVAAGGPPAADALARPQLHLPPGAGALLRRVVSCLGADDLIESAFGVHEYAVSDRLRLGPLEVGFCSVPHFVATCAVGLAGDGGRLVFSADCGPNEELVRFARAADLLLIEATLPLPPREGPRGHLTAREAGEHGRAAAARRLVLTHYSDELDARLTAAAGVDGYEGPVELAHEGGVYTV